MLTTNIQKVRRIVSASGFLGGPPTQLIKDFTGIEGFTSLEYLEISGHKVPISHLDLSKNTSLKELKLEFNYHYLKNLDVSKNTGLTKLSTRFTQLTSLDVSNNTALTTLKCWGNSSLTCIQVSQTQFDNIPSEWSKDSGANYSLNCN